MKPTILLMDSDAHTLEQLQGVLQRNHYPVRIAADGHAALRLIEEQPPGLVVSDLLLAGLDGYKVWAHLRATKSTTTIPILVVSALNVPAPHEPYQFVPDGEWQTLVYDAFLPKPLDLRRFQRYVEKLLNPTSNLATPTGSSVVVSIEEETLQKQLVNILQTYSYGVDVFSNIEATLNHVRMLPPAALILDYRQPDDKVRHVALQVSKFVPQTNLILITNPPEDVDNELYKACASTIRLPLESRYINRVLSNVLDSTNRQQRNKVLTSQLITTNQYLMESQQALRAQNEELQHVNHQLREADGLKEIFTGMVVHDLKSPLSAMLGAINFTLIDPRISLADRNKDMLNGAIGAGNQMLRLIETLLEGQRLRDGRAELDLEPFDIPDIFEDSLLSISPLLTLHKLHVEQNLAEELPVIYADPYMSQRILENLLDNAIKFSPREGVITIRAIVKQAGFVEIRIEDEGPGIPAEEQAEIFNRFARAKGNTRAGFGLGLAFCHQATEAMGGQIWVESDGQSGTSFVFTLPQYEGQLENIEF